MIGIQPSEFWCMTPWMMKVIHKAYLKKHENDHRARSWLAWHTAALTRMADMPSFADFAAPPGNKSSSKPELPAGAQLLGRLRVTHKVIEKGR